MVTFKIMYNDKKDDYKGFFKYNYWKIDVRKLSYLY